MRTLTAFIGTVSALAAISFAAVSQADGAKTPQIARTALERSVFHDQSSAGAVARPAFTVSRVRCVEARSFCNVTRQTDTRTFSKVERVRVRLVRETGSRQWSYRGVDQAAAAAIDEGRAGRTLWAISATTGVVE